MALNIISIAIAVALLWVAYRLLFINSNRLAFNRAFLIIALGFSLILPAAGFYIGRSTPQIVSYRQSLFQGIMLDEVVITAEGVAISTPADNVADESAAPVVAKNRRTFDFIGLISLIWLIGAIGAALVFLFKLGKIVFIIIRSPKKKMPGYTAVFTGKEHGSYSFFNYAFFPDENVNEEIVRHEMSHIAHHHSADILFVELMMIIQWFNPFIYLYKRELQSLHEYMADRDVVATGIDKQNYMMLILQQCTAVDFSNMSNNFSFILTKKRLKMITQNKKAKGVVIKALLTLPLFALLLFANCKSNGQTENKVKSPDETTIKNQSMTVFKISDGTYLSLSDPLDITIDGTHLILNLNSVKNDTTIMIGEHELVAKNNHDERNSFSVTLDGEALDINLLGGILANNDDYHPQGEDEVCMSVEKAPEFPGGANAIMDYLRGNLKYPESAKKNKQEGRVFIGFVVEKDGSVSNVNVLRGVCEELDNEAVRVVKAMPRWTPGMNEGKPVRVQYTLPVVFKLNGESTMTTLSGTQWEGRGIGVMDGVTYDMFMTMSFYQDNDGLFVMKLVAEQNGEKAVVFKDVALDFKYTFDGKSTGSIQPKNPDGSDLGEAQPPYGFVVKEKSIVVNFYDFKNDCGIEEITFMKK